MGKKRHEEDEGDDDGSKAMGLRRKMVGGNEGPW